jgi:hypothetical protein
MAKDNGYVGKVSHQGAQVVKGPYVNGGQAKGGNVIKGEDLRTGKKGK